MSALPRLVLVVASAANDVIGHQGGMPWHLPADLAHFKRLTLGGSVLMGRRTFDSLGDPPRPLPRRRNLVLTRDTNWQAEGVERVAGLDEALRRVPGTLHVIGGARVYELAWPQAQVLHWTRIAAEPPGDTYFRPDLSGWQRVAVEERAADEKNPHALRFERWERGAP